MDMILEYCDSNDDGILIDCEIHNCVVMIENEWRAENCPDYATADNCFIYPCEAEC